MRLPRGTGSREVHAEIGSTDMKAVIFETTFTFKLTPNSPMRVHPGRARLPRSQMFNQMLSYLALVNTNPWWVLPSLCSDPLSPWSEVTLSTGTNVIIVIYLLKTAYLCSVEGSISTKLYTGWPRYIFKELRDNVACLLFSIERSNQWRLKKNKHILVNGKKCD